MQRVTRSQPRGRHQDQNGQTGGQQQNIMVQPTAHDWEDEKNRDKDFFDDGTMTFFWRAHSLTVLVVFILVLIYVALFEDTRTDVEFNTKRGIIAMVLVFVLFGVTHVPDGPFKRPHPALWRFFMCLSIVYELVLVFMLFQTVDDARQLLTNVDNRLGKPLPEKDYGGNCRIYDPDNLEDPWHNLMDKMDGFVLVHFFGWWLKTLILRDYWLCIVLSVMFEVMEWTLEHQLPNFRECWWDHWFMDIIICNGFGIFFGMKTLNYLRMKPYHWRGMWNIPSFKGKVSRVFRQFTPYVWTDFEWHPTSSLKRWLSMLLLISAFLLAELNTFYMKFVLWIPPPHFLCLGRLVLFLFWGAVCMRETFEFLDSNQCKKFGAQSWIIVAVITTEVLICLKFDWETITKPLPPHILWFWGIFFSGLVLWTIWHFYLQRLLTHTERKLPNNDQDHAGAPQENQRITRSKSTRKQL